MSELELQTHQLKVFYACLLLVALAFYGVFVARTAFAIGDEVYLTLVDDAMISMRYARNLADGHGIVWNVGDEPIQGYTNLGWMLYMALLHLLGFAPSKISLVVMATGAPILLANILVVKRLAEHQAPGDWLAPALAAIAVAFYFPLVYWTLRGLEVGILGLLVNLAALLALRTIDSLRWRSTLAFSAVAVLAVLIRLDAIPQLCILVAFVAGCAKGRGRLWHMACMGAAVVVVVLALYLFQTAYFGEFLPNTYYLKMTGLPLTERLERGAEVFARVALGDIGFPLLVIAAGLLLHKSALERKVLLLLALFGVQCLYSIYVGGDSSEYDVGGANRFITQGMGFLFVVFGCVLSHLLQDIKPLDTVALRQLNSASLRLFLFLGLATVFLVSGQQWLVWVIKNAPALESDIVRAKVGVLVREGTEQDATVAAHAAGQIPYFAERRAVDLLGRSDAVIAKGPRAWGSQPGHNKWDYAYSILELQPDVVADEWMFSRSFLEAHSDEYEVLPNGIWVKRSSELVDRDLLARDYR
jgi:arabinofuranosyltransferase